MTKNAIQKKTVYHLFSLKNTIQKCFQDYKKKYACNLFKLDLFKTVLQLRNILQPHRIVVLFTPSIPILNENSKLLFLIQSKSHNWKTTCAYNNLSAMPKLYDYFTGLASSPTLTHLAAPKHKGRAFTFHIETLHKVLKTFFNLRQSSKVIRNSMFGQRSE